MQRLWGRVGRRKGSKEGEIDREGKKEEEGWSTMERQRSGGR